MAFIAYTLTVILWGLSGHMMEESGITTVVVYSVHGGFFGMCLTILVQKF